MTITILDTTMTSDSNPHTARHAPGRGWEVSWLPGQILDRNTAITAMTLAEAAEESLDEGHRLWPFIQGWAAELGLTGPDAIARAAQPPSGSRPPEQPVLQPGPETEPEAEAETASINDPDPDPEVEAARLAYLEVEAAAEARYAQACAADPEAAAERGTVWDRDLDAFELDLIEAYGQYLAVWHEAYTPQAEPAGEPDMEAEP